MLSKLTSSAQAHHGSRLQRRFAASTPSSHSSNSSKSSDPVRCRWQTAASAMAAGGGAAAAAAAAGGPVDAAPLFRFGVLSDVQYADIPDGTSFHGVPRFYRDALVATRRAVEAGWRPEDVSFGLHLGDTLDGFQPKEHSVAALNRVLDAFDALGPGRPTYHTLSNHDLYNLPRPQLQQLLRIPAAPDGAGYYSFQPHPGWRVVMLDGYDVSLLGWPAGHPRHEAAAAILQQHNPNENKNSPEGLMGLQRRFVQFGGGVSEQQLAWLDEELQAADAQGQCVLVGCHLPLCPDTAPPACLLWNYDAVLALLQRTPGLVAMTLAGHSHQNGSRVDAAGIHHLVLPAVVETPPGRDAYGCVDVFADRLVLRGADTCMSCVCRLTDAGVARQQQRKWAAMEAAAGGASADSDVVVDVADAAASSTSDAVKAQLAGLTVSPPDAAAAAR